MNNILLIPAWAIPLVMGDGLCWPDTLQGANTHSPFLGVWPTADHQLSPSPGTAVSQGVILPKIHIPLWGQLKFHCSSKEVAKAQAPCLHSLDSVGPWLFCGDY